MILSVFTRHSSICKFKRDRLCRRCSCPKWVGGQVNKEYFRQSASTRLWDEAEQLREKLEAALAKGVPLSDLQSYLAPPEAPALALSSPPAPEPLLLPESPVAQCVPAVLPPALRQPPDRSPRSLVYPAGRRKERVTVQRAVEAYMTDARSRGLQSDTVNKLARIFEKQFLPWTRAEGLEYLDEVDLDALISFRSTWHEGAMVKAKKQDRVIGFFWESFRRNFISQNPALSLSKIRPKHIPRHVV